MSLSKTKFITTFVSYFIIIGAGSGGSQAFSTNIFPENFHQSHLSSHPCEKEHKSCSRMCRKEYTGLKKREKCYERCEATLHQCFKKSPSIYYEKDPAIIVEPPHPYGWYRYHYGR